MKTLFTALLLALTVIAIAVFCEGAFTTTNSYTTGFAVGTQSLSNETTGITIKYRDFTGADYVTIAVYSGAIFVKPSEYQDYFEIDGTATNRQMWFYVGLSNVYKIAVSPSMSFQIKCTNSVNNIYKLGYCN